MTDLLAALEPEEKVRWRQGRLIVQNPRTGYWATRLAASPRPAMEHELKCVEPYFTEVKIGRKPFEYRRADRDFRMLDTVKLRKWDPVAQEYTGHETTRMIGFILDEFPGLDPDFVVFGLVPTVGEAQRKHEAWLAAHPRPPSRPKADCE